jgi:glycosyltransferase involved in cell wall biosynthesis
VVVTDLPAMADIVDDQESGIVVPQKNPKRIADAVSRLLEDPKLRRRLGERGRRAVLRRFDWNIIARRYRLLIDSQIGRPRRDGGGNDRTSPDL